MYNQFIDPYVSTDVSLDGSVSTTCTTYGSLSPSRTDCLLLLAVAAAAATVATAADCVADNFVDAVS